MVSSNMAASQRLVNLAQQLRLVKPLCPPSNTMEDPTHPRERGSSRAELKPENLKQTQFPNHRKKNQTQESRGPDLPLRRRKWRSPSDSHQEIFNALHSFRSALLVPVGDVALPGGKREEGDADDIETALREAKEEIGLDPSLVDVVTVLEPISTKIGMAVVPVVGILVDNRAFIPTPNAAEVAAIFDAL
ncbi:nudix hydrolase homolog 22 [Actinidia rufa]|uniref:Nudix hydrolase homolog 22 n=1 Tax=Actinidia rufa TaxID=165716 RepID=A0A7J0FWM8_9ERIC|nr:nudix hydrolase homolog 22 [Actinidia rufa]